MKVKDFIAMLQKENLEDHVRVPGGAVLFAESKPGYWDGAYSYRDGENFVISTRGSKVDIITQDADDFIWENDGDYSKIILDFHGYSGETLKRHIKKYKDKFEETAQQVKQFHQRSLESHFYAVAKKLKEGWKIREDKNEKSRSKMTMSYVKDGKKDKRMCMGDCQTVHKSGLFVSYDEGKRYRYWKIAA